MAAITSIKWRQLTGLGNTAARQDVKDTQNQIVDELNALLPDTDGTATASGIVVTDSNNDISGLRNITATGTVDAATVTADTFSTDAESAEHGAGFIGTAATPTTYRWTEPGGVIVTRITFDLTGLASVADADDVIGLAAGGAAYLGRYVTATNGIVFKVNLACLETPAGGDNDIDLKTSSSAVAAYDTDGNAFGSVFNSGDWVAGTCRENLVPALTANDYFYLTAGTGDTAATYTAGMYVLTLWGHAVLA